ncbi:murein transglycosylase A [Caballeronia sp. TF1N1]|uniref:murein transglycosylase A n=1 Tax=Caballeronia sp. TF1N1 TaxID=2878153 RepID=UPI001FD46DE0|nr:murein transglycosylase A [Caballeronia sp. TF1N1]
MAPRTSGVAAQPDSTPGQFISKSGERVPCATSAVSASKRATKPASTPAAAWANSTMRVLCVLTAGAIAACASAPDAGTQAKDATREPVIAAAPAGAVLALPGEQGLEEARMVSSAASGAEPGVANPLPASPSASLAGTATPFATKNALYTPVAFASVPGWATDNVAESWDAFRRSCGVLSAKPAWAAPCAASRGIDASNGVAVRRFFEDNFTVYQIRNVDKSPRGVLTGYYEPILKGSRRFGAPYVYPVYGVPRDMLFLDSRRLAPDARSSAIAARIDGRSVIPLTTVPMGGAKGVYALELGDSLPDIRDKRLRLRLEGNRIVPYYSRAEIERGKLNAPILAYVEDPAMLYSMQLQGAGKIRLPDGAVMRLAYAEQNGLAFNPPVASAGSKGRKVLVRGVEIDLEEGTVSTQMTQADASASDDAPQSALLRGAQEDASPDGASAPAGGDAGAQADSEAASPLLRGFNLAKGATPAVRPARVSAPSSMVSSAHADNKPGSLAGTPPLGYTFASSDPSYVFFRAIPDSPMGPIGALGVPLSAGRSAAIDPRTTPLGAPVFINASDGAAQATSVTRLLMAQDAGGAIRGAVRADYFFGTGPQAQQQASRMKQPAQMWVLLPKGLRISARESGVRVRGGPSLPSADCVVSDPDLCVDETP